MSMAAVSTHRDRLLVGLGFLVGGVALPWLPGPWLPGASTLTVAGLAFVLPATALVACIGQAVVGAWRSTSDASSQASTGAIAVATTVLCSFALCLQLLLLTTLVDAPFRLPAPARAAVVLFGLHLIAVGNVMPRLRPGWPSGVSDQMSEGRRRVWMRIYRAAGYLCVVIGAIAVVAGAGFAGPHIDAALKVALVTGALWASWSVCRVTTA